ncbi:MAG TPA: hypothetical protein VKT82_08300 [Ktedonobacterales bacterium]|nr:hypothetical protein [Ktedonobacterales bacterium]
MRHAIQKAGHECLPLLFMLVACGTGMLFYLGNFWPGSPPGWVVVPVLVTLAICTEWRTFTFNQGMQDAFTARRGRGFPVLRALLASAVSTFIFATASSGLWAPLGADDKALWAWILAVGVFGSQLFTQTGARESQSATLPPEYRGGHRGMDAWGHRRGAGSCRGPGL